MACNWIEKQEKEGGSEYISEEIKDYFIQQAQKQLTHETHGEAPTMPNEMTPLEIAESLEYQAAHTISMPDKDKTALEQGAAYICKIANGELSLAIHAHWIPYKGKKDIKILTQCSHCHNIVFGTPKYCDKCGAVMDEMEDTNVKTKQNG